MGAEIDERSQQLGLTADAELGLTAAMEGEAKVNDDEAEDGCGETPDEETVLKYFTEKGAKFVDLNADLATRSRTSSARCTRRRCVHGGRGDGGGEGGGGGVVSGAAGGTRGRGSNPAGETDEDEEVVFAQEREAKERDEEKRKERAGRRRRG